MKTIISKTNVIINISETDISKIGAKITDIIGAAPTGYTAQEVENICKNIASRYENSDALDALLCSYVVQPGAAVQFADYLILQPNIQFTMSDSILLRSGEQTGQLIHSNNFSISVYNEARKRETTFQSDIKYGVALLDQENVVVLPNTSFVRYNGGGDTTFMDRMDSGEGSLWVLPLPRGHLQMFDDHYTITSKGNDVETTYYQGFQCVYPVGSNVLASAQVRTSRSPLGDRGSMIGARAVFDGIHASLPSVDYEKVLRTLK